MMTTLYSQVSSSVDAPGGSLREGLLPLPYKEPSGTLLITRFLCRSRNKICSDSDQKIGDSVAANAPSEQQWLMERGARVMSYS